MSDAPEKFSSAVRRFTWPAKLSLGLLTLAVVALSVRLWPDWRHNPDLSHGLFMPVVFLVLLNESRTGSPRWLPAGATTGGLFGALLLAGLLALSVAGLYAAALGWSHAVVNFTLVSALALLLGAALVAFTGESVRLVPCNWSAIVAIGLWLLCAPIPPGTYSRLTISLQLMVSENTVRALHLFGVAAVRHGNIIELARATVGVEEACSGVRSLVSCIFAGFFFSATLVRQPWARALLIALAAPLALVMNFLRALTLTLLANDGVDISGTWHDATGFAVLGMTAVILGALALLLERREKKSTAASSPPSALGSQSTAKNFRLIALASGLTLAGALAAVFALNTHPTFRTDAPVPNLAALLPTSAAGWRVETDTDIRQFSSTLHTDVLAQRTYLRDTRAGIEQVTIYVAYWRAGQAPVSLVASHTPDACWPGSGWTSITVPPPAAPVSIGDRELPRAEYRFFKNGDFPQYVWFWHLYDRQLIDYSDPFSPLALLRSALRYGFSHDGDQLFVRVSSNRPWLDFQREPWLQEFFQRTQSLGL